MTKTLSLFFAGSFLTIFSTFFSLDTISAAKEYPKQSTDFYVNDLANVIDNDTEKYIIEANVKLREQAQGSQIVVMTVNSLDGEDIESYATGVFRQYGIGDKNKNNGTLILLSIEDRASRIETGYGTEGFITDAASGRIQDAYMIPEFKNNNWNKGLRQGFDAVLGYYYKEYNINIENTTAYTPTNDNEDEFTLGSGITLAIGFILSFAASFAEKHRKKIRIGALIIFGLGITGLIAFPINGPWNSLSLSIAAIGFLVLLGTFGITPLIFALHSGGGHGSRGGGSSGHSGGGGRSGGGGSSRHF